MKVLMSVCLLAVLASCGQPPVVDQSKERVVIQNEKKTDADWQAELTPEQYRVTRKAGTERPGSGAYLHHKKDGTYTCAGCGATLFMSKEKFDSGSGWPSFWETANSTNVITCEDHSLGRTRTEVLCAHCGAHLGHVFDDGPQPTGLRYCINSVCLGFEDAKE